MKEWSNITYTYIGSIEKILALPYHTSLDFSIELSMRKRFFMMERTVLLLNPQDV